MMSYLACSHFILVLSYVLPRATYYLMRHESEPCMFMYMFMVSGSAALSFVYTLNTDTSSDIHLHIA